MTDADPDDRVNSSSSSSTHTTNPTGLIHPETKDQTVSPTTSLSGIQGGNYPNDDNKTIPAATTTTSNSLRRQLGSELAQVSDLINNNLIVVRYATFSTILVLGAYGIANTPLFYRYKHVLDIPSQMFQKRRWIHGRIVGVVSENEKMRYRVRDHSRQSSFQSSLSNSSTWASGFNNDNEKADSIQHDYHHRPILVLVRHSSPMERLLTQSAMERILTSSSTRKSSSFPSHQNLLLIELAGISSAPPLTSTTTTRASSIPSSTSPTNESEETSPFPLLDRLVQQKSKVSLQLLAQRRNNTPRDYNIIPAFAQRGNNIDIDTNNLPMSDDEDDDGMNYTAICHLHYYHHPPKSSWFESATKNNASLEMVRSGQAWIHPAGCVVVPLPPAPGKTCSTTTGKTTTLPLHFHPTTVKQLKDDAHFLSQLERAEYSSWKSKVGIWSSEEMRGLRTEYLAEEFSRGGSAKWQFWNIVQRGWEWMWQR